MIGSAEEFKRLRESSNPEEYFRAAHEEASIETWNSVLEKFPTMATWVAHNKCVPLEILERLSTHPDRMVRWTVAGKRKATKGILEVLMTDSDDGVRMAVARNSKAPQTILEQMIDDAWDETREVIRVRLTE